jgi:hypothetical protein
LQSIERRSEGFLEVIVYFCERIKYFFFEPISFKERATLFSPLFSSFSFESSLFESFLEFLFGEFDSLLLYLEFVIKLMLSFN